MSGRSDEWKSRCNFPPAGGKVAPPAFTMDWAFPMNGCPDGLGVPDEWAFRRRLFEGNYSKEWRTRYFSGVAHTIIVLVAHTMFCGSGAHDTFWAFPFNGQCWEYPRAPIR